MTTTKEIRMRTTDEDIAFFGNLKEIQENHVGTGMAMTDEIRSLYAEIAGRESKLNDLLQRWADEECPIKVGDVVTVPDWHHCHARKQARVVEVLGVITPYGRRCYFKIHATVLKKDGTDSYMKAEWGEEP